jgi:hypothetical protein
VDTQSFADIYLAVGFLVGLLIFRDMSILRSAAFKQAGHNKWLWLLLWLVSLVLLFFWIPVGLWYLIRIRPSVARADSVHLQERKRQKEFRRQQAIERQRARPAPGRTSTGSTTMRSSNVAQPCSSCGGSGNQTCFACQGRGRHNSSTPSAYGAYAVQDWCAPCTGSGKIKCSSCSGTGKRR